MVETTGAQRGGGPAGMGQMTKNGAKRGKGERAKRKGIGKEIDILTAIILTWVQAKRWGSWRGGPASSPEKGTEIGIPDICPFKQFHNVAILYSS
jgi:hypothetical protein